MDLLTDGFSILLLIIGFGLLIFVHELGHFVAAKWAGIRTEAFAIGFGRPIVSWRKGIGLVMGSTDRRVAALAGRGPRELTDADLARHGLGETEYSIRWLPLGGFVRMLGQDDLAPAATSTEDRSFNSTAIWKRMIVVSAGVVMNLIFAAILFVIAFSVGVRFEAPVVGAVIPGSQASLATGTGTAKDLVGLRSGDTIVSVDGDAVSTFVDVQIDVAMAEPGNTLDITVDRAGYDEPLTFQVLPTKSETAGVQTIGIAPASSNQLAGSEGEEAYALIESYLKREGLWSAGLRPGMRVVEVDGQAVTTLGEFQEIVAGSSGGDVPTRWAGDGTTIDIDMAPAPRWPVMRTVGGQEAQQGLLGLVPLVKIASVLPGSANTGVLLPGDVIMRIGDVQAPRMAQFRKAIASHGAGEIEIVVQRDGDMIPVQARIVEHGLFKPRAMLDVGPGLAWDVPRVANPIRTVECDVDGTGTLQATDTVVADAGIMGGSRLVSVNEHPIASWREFFDAVAAHPTGDLVLAFENPTPGREIRTMTVNLDDDQCVSLAGLGYRSMLIEGAFDPVYTLRSSGGNPITAIEMGIRETVKLILLTYLTIDRVVGGSVGVDQLQGPVGIVHIGTKIVDRGFTYLIFFLALISVNLAVVNFLPLPIVDGGLFLNLIYEKIKGRPPSPAFQNAAAILGLLLIAAVFLTVTYNDLVRIVG
ncbi:MAG: site-2 protease family protein [Phycisphaerales bacterium]|nr:site-2 protease family protein [Phycisphaerales bacterium]